LTFEKLINEKSYTITINYEKDIDKSDQEFTLFLQDFLFTDIFGKFFINFKRVGLGALYCPERVNYLKQYDIEVWPGFKYKIVTSPDS
jgi:hypothetical protein